MSLRKRMWAVVNSRGTIQFIPGPVIGKLPLIFSTNADAKYWLFDEPGRRVVRIRIIEEPGKGEEE